MKKTLLLMRHAKSSWKDEELKDFDRPLNKRGKKDAPLMAELLEEQKLLPELILSSSAKRASRTAKVIAESCKDPENVLLTLDSLYLAEPQAYLDEISAHGGEVERLMIVGHNPGLEALAQLLTNKVVSLSTSTIAVIELPIKNWKDIKMDGEGKLKELFTSKEVSKKKK